MSAGYFETSSSPSGTCCDAIEVATKADVIDPPAILRM